MDSSGLSSVVIFYGQALTHGNKSGPVIGLVREARLIVRWFIKFIRFIRFIRFIKWAHKVARMKFYDFTNLTTLRTL